MPIIGLVFLLISPAVNSGTDTELVITSWGRPMFVARLAGAPVGGWSKQMYESIYSLQNTVRRISYNTVDSPKYININKYYQGRAGRLHSSAQLATASPCWISRLEKDLACSREERLELDCWRMPVIPIHSTLALTAPLATNCCTIFTYVLLENDM